MKTKSNVPTCKQIEKVPVHRALLRGTGVEQRVSKLAKSLGQNDCPWSLPSLRVRAAFLPSLALLYLLSCAFAFSATVTGTLQDISIQALNTKLMFAPTNVVLLTPTGLNAGPPRTIETANGQFSIVLEAGDYTVSLPLVPWRRPFCISVFPTNGTVNITNLLCAPATYTYTNNLNYTVKAVGYDSTPDFLDAKLNVAGSLAKVLVTNAGAISITLSNAEANTFWTANGDDIYYNAGKVGIGVSNPSASLEVNGSASFGGGIVSITADGDIEISDNTKGVILHSPDGGRFRIKVSNDGTLSTEDLN